VGGGRALIEHLAAPAIRNTHDPTLALLVWLLNLDGDQPDCCDICWRDYCELRRDEVLADCRNGDDCCPFGQVLLLYLPETIRQAVHRCWAPCERLDQSPPQELGGGMLTFVPLLTGLLPA